MPTSYRLLRPIVGFHVQGGKIEKIPAGALVRAEPSEGMCMVIWEGREVWVQFNDIRDNAVTENEGEDG